MKKLILIAILIVVGFQGVRAQNDRIKALKIAFITQRLQLTPAEAQRFWPVYDQYDNELNAARLDDADPNVLDRDKRVLAIKEKYMGEFQRIIGPDKTNTLFNAENEFRSILIRRLQNRNQMRMNKFRRLP